MSQIRNSQLEHTLYEKFYNISNLKPKLVIEKKHKDKHNVSMFLFIFFPK